MRRSLLDKRIPTLLAIILIGVGLSVVTFLVQKRVIYFGNAAASDIPKKVQVTNISDSSFTITYITDAAVLGAVSYGIDKNIPQTALDDRDQPTGIPTAHTVHSITIKNLQQKSTYYFSIKSGETTYLNNNTLFQIVTGPQINSPPTDEKPLTGKVVSANGDTPTDVLIFAQTTDGQLLSTLVKPTGFYIIPLNTMRDKTLESYVSVSNDTSLQIDAIDSTTIAHANFSLGGENAVPLLTLSKDYDFTKSETPLATQASSLASLPSFGDINASNSGDITTTITTPKNNEGIVDSQPEIKGIAPPNASVEITIHSSQTINAKITASSQGAWSFRPTTPLSPGLHTITVTIKDTAGKIIKTIQQSFIVYAEGSQVNQSATPSAVPSFSPTDTPTTTVTITPTTPIISLSPTVSPSPTTIALTSFTPTPTLLTFVSGTPSVLTPTPRLITGSESIPFIGIIGVITLVAGACIFFATQGASL